MTAKPPPTPMEACRRLVVEMRRLIVRRRNVDGALCGGLMAVSEEEVHLWRRLAADAERAWGRQGDGKDWGAV